MKATKLLPGGSAWLLKQGESAGHTKLTRKGDKVNKKLKSPALDLLFQAILQLKNERECYRFFEDLCTVPELKTLAQRFYVAALLAANESYAEIAKKTGASTATISRVKRSLYYGADGYRLALKKLQLD